MKRTSGKTAYIAGPYSGSVESNIQSAIEVANACITHGISPYCPHLNHYLNRYFSRSYDDWMAIDLEWLQRSDAVIRIPGESPGADLEVREAVRLHIPVFYAGMDGTIDEACERIKHGRVRFAMGLPRAGRSSNGHVSTTVAKPRPGGKPGPVEPSDQPPLPDGPPPAGDDQGVIHGI